MDEFGVPKKINRHVLKALYYMKDHDFKNPKVSEICELVEITMKNNVPVRDLHGVVLQSLKNMALLGVIEKRGSHFFVQNANTSPVFPQQLDPKIFRMNERKNDGSKLDPNLKRRRDASADSMSGSEIEKARKRFRSKKTVSQKGHSVTLPKARMWRKKLNMNAELDQDDSDSNDNNNYEEDEAKSDCSLNTNLRNQFLCEVSKNEVEKSPTESHQSSENKTGSSSEQNQNNNGEKEPLQTSSTVLNAEEVVTAEQKVEDEPKEDAKCSDVMQDCNSKS